MAQEGILGRSMTAEIAAMSDGERPFAQGSEAERDAALTAAITAAAIEDSRAEIKDAATAAMPQDISNAQLNAYQDSLARRPWEERPPRQVDPTHFLKALDPDGCVDGDDYDD